MQTTHTHAQVYRNTRKLGHTNACWQLALATRGEREKTRVDNNEWEKLGKRERDEKKQKGERKRELIG